MSTYNENGYETSTTAQRGLLTATFKDRESAERAYEALQRRGYTSDDINLVMSDEARKRHFGDVDSRDKGANTDLGNKSLEAAGAGSAIGGTLGAIAGAIAAIGTTLVIPGLGLVVAGPLAAALAGAGAGGLTGGLLGALIGAGIPEERAKLYESNIKEGNIVLGVHPKSEEDARYLEQEWRNNNAHNIHY
ncbi:hypothetical protein QNI19_37170 [Cytophagaceae bacterium DM2B3-1]|uniref:General stress protein 17M-like domain-containing protein n=1 Tax=Xanthocytophaga flava TaxID=3048013 RepID=A0ABT7CY88_9BACT|nr:hypothetical protein [Xanthocytophaga flavus]MDJ1467130.1 hypothetical protein [Xanthocytophaga flavus]MDJ1498626.1 hypothetical protein [Xanthocytophaga flavus]